MAGDHYLALISAELQEERRAIGSVEQRASAVISTSGALAALLFGFAALASGGVGGIKPVPSLLLAEALVLFIAAAIQGLRAMLPGSRYAVVRTTSLDKVLAPRYWDAPASIGSRRSAEVLVKLIGTARAVNDARGRVLRRAIMIEIAAVALLTAAIIIHLVP